MLQLELMARALKLCKENALPVSQFADKMGGKYKKMIDLAGELQIRGLLVKTMKRLGKGRAQCLLRTTPLGEQFIEQYDRLLNLRLHVSDNDIKKALHQADQARRLKEEGISSYARFQEVNELAGHIAGNGNTAPSLVTGGGASSNRWNPPEPGKPLDTRSRR